MLISVHILHTMCTVTWFDWEPPNLAPPLFTRKRIFGIHCRPCARSGLLGEEVFIFELHARCVWCQTFHAQQPLDDNFWLSFNRPFFQRWLQVRPGLSVALKGELLWTGEAGFLGTGCSFSHTTNSVKALKRSQNFYKVIQCTPQGQSHRSPTAECGLSAGLRIFGICSFAFSTLTLLVCCVTGKTSGLWKLSVGTVMMVIWRGFAHIRVMLYATATSFVSC